MNKIKIYLIGKIENKEGSVCIKLDPKYAEGLKPLTVTVMFKSFGGQMAVTKTKTGIL